MKNFPDFGLGQASRSASRLPQSFREVAQTHFKGKLHQYLAQKGTTSFLRTRCRNKGGGQFPPPSPHRPAMPGCFLLQPQALFESIVYIARRGRFSPRKQAKASNNRVSLQPQQVLRGSISNISKSSAFGRFGE